MLRAIVLSLVLLWSGLACAQVTLDANATAAVSGLVSGTITNNNLTVGTGSNRCLVAQLNFYSGGVTPTGVAVTWNGISLTQIGTEGTAFLFGLVNPASGNHALVATWTGGSLYAALNGTSFTNCAQTGTFINVNTATGSSLPSSLAITNPSGNIAVDSVVSTGPLSSPSQTQLYVDNTNSYSGSSYSINVNPTFSWSKLSTPYTGPGDLVSGATAWWGLRAYDAAVAATGTTKAVSLRRARDNTTCNFDINTSGNLGGSDSGCSLGGGLSLATFATQDATATCTIATTTATCTSVSSTPHVGSTLTGAGLTEPCYASAVGTFTSGAGTVTVGGVGSSPCGTIASGETLTFTYGLYIAEMYDQTANGYNITQATAANQPQLLPSCLNSLPCIGFYGSQNLVSGTITTSAIPNSLSLVVNFPSTSTLQRLEATSGTSIQMGHYSTTNTVYAFAGSYSTATASDLAWHALQGITATGSTGGVSVDGTETTGTTGTSSSATPFYFGSNSLLAHATGFATETGLWLDLAFSSGQQTSLCHNQYTYWGTSVSC